MPIEKKIKHCIKVKKKTKPEPKIINSYLEVLNVGFLFSLKKFLLK